MRLVVGMYYTGRGVEMAIKEFTTWVFESRGRSYLRIVSSEGLSKGNHALKFEGDILTESLPDLIQLLTTIVQEYAST